MFCLGIKWPQVDPVRTDRPVTSVSMGSNAIGRTTRSSMNEKKRMKGFAGHLFFIKKKTATAATDTIAMMAMMT